MQDGCTEPCQACLSQQQLLAVRTNATTGKGKQVETLLTAYQLSMLLVLGVVV